MTKVPVDNLCQRHDVFSTRPRPSAGVMKMLDTELINVSVAHLESIYSNLMGDTDNNWRMSVKTAVMLLLMSGTLVAQQPGTSVSAAPGGLTKPNTLIVDHSLSRATLAAEILAAGRYDTFWDNGDEALARAALAPDFIDNTPPSGRSQRCCRRL